MAFPHAVQAMQNQAVRHCAELSAAEWEWVQQAQQNVVEQQVQQNHQAQAGLLSSSMKSMNALFVTAGLPVLAASPT